MEKQIKIALAGNPNCGKTTLFNALTGSNQFVGNWPGVTVEKKEGRLKKHDDVVIMDLPGIYSLSPYTLEEVVARNYLIDERPDAILNIVDGTNLERNLYLTTQLTELGIPVVMAVNMMDIVRKSGDQINISQLSQQLGCKVVEISALKGDGVMDAAEAAIEAAKSTKTVPMHTFSGPVEHAIAHIEEAAVHKMPEEQQRWYAIKIFERDDKVLAKLHIPEDVHQHIEADIKAAEEELDDDAESIITNERYVYIAEVIRACYRKKSKATQSTSDKIDRIVTNRWLGLPIFAVVMFLVYWVAMVAVGAPATDWANDGVFGDGWHLLGIGSSAYNDANDEYTAATEAVDAFLGLDTEAEDFDADATLAEMKDFQPTSDTATTMVEDEETLAENEMTAYYDNIPDDADKDSTVGMTYVDAVAYLEANGFDAPDPADYGVWVPGIPVLIGNGLEKAGCADWLQGLILDLLNGHVAAGEGHELFPAAVRAGEVLNVGDELRPAVETAGAARLRLDAQGHAVILRAVGHGDPAVGEKARDNARERPDAHRDAAHALERLLAGDIAHHFEHRVAQCQLVHYLLTAFFTMLPARLTTPSATLIGMVSYEPACQSRTFLRWMASNLHFVVHRPQPMHR